MATTEPERIRFDAWDRDTGRFVAFLERQRWRVGADVVVSLVDERTGRAPWRRYYAPKLQNRYRSLEEAVQALRARGGVTS